MEPKPPAESPHRGMPSSPLSPSSRSVIPAAADGDDEALVSEHPCVTLDEWWLATVEGDDQKKIAVAGIFRNQAIQQYSPAPIAKRLTPLVLETEDGTILNLGSYSVLQTYQNGYSTTVGAEFLNGFPDQWESYKACHSKLTNSHTECQLCSSNASNSGVGSTQFYLEQYEKGRHFDLVGTNFISKFHGNFGSFSNNDAQFQKSSHLLNGTPRFEEYTCDVATNENAAATGDQRSPVVSLEVRECRKETQRMSLTEKAAVDDEMRASVNLDMQNSFCLSNGTPILEEHTFDDDIPPNEGAAASNGDNERYTATPKEVNNMEKGLVTGSPSREKGHDDIATDVSLAPTVECTNNSVSELVHRTPATITYRRRTPVASLKSKGSWKENQHIPSNKKPVGRPKKQMSPHEKCQSATSSPGIRNPASYPVVRPKKQISSHEKYQSATKSPGTRNPASIVLWSPLTRDMAKSLSMSTPEDLQLKRSRSGRVIVPKLDEGRQSIVYGRDGMIAAVIGLDSPAVPTWSESKSDRRKKRKTG